MNLDLALALVVNPLTNLCQPRVIAVLILSEPFSKVMDPLGLAIATIFIGPLGNPEAE